MDEAWEIKRPVLLLTVGLIGVCGGRATCTPLRMRDADIH